MGEGMVELGRRAVAAKGWRWMPGTLSVRKDRVTGAWDIRVRATIGMTSDSFWRSEGWLPDLTDPATLGCLLALVREACAASRPGAALSVQPWPHDGGFRWAVFVTAPGESVAQLTDGQDSEAAALVAALECAP